MPIYTYRCKNCGVQFDQKQSFTEQSLTRCPECSKKALYKVYHPVGIVFKGKGFYSTDHKSPSGASFSAGKEKNGESKEKTSEDKEETKSESKTETTVKTKSQDSESKD
jgi:putative FmdB family regulatory protein